MKYRYKEIAYIQGKEVSLKDLKEGRNYFNLYCEEAEAIGDEYFIIIHKKDFKYIGLINPYKKGILDRGKLNKYEKFYEAVSIKEKLEKL